MRTLLIIFNLVILCIFGYFLFKPHKEIITLPKEDPISSISPLPERKKEIPPFKISNYSPDYMDYDTTIDRLKEWNKECPELTEVGTYGESTRGKSLYYFRINNKNSGAKPKVLITACIHGNEPLASSTVTWYMGSLLDQYQKDAKIKELIDSRDIYFIPIVSPDSYPHSRYVDGVDPNRNFPGLTNNKKSVKPVAALQDFYMKILPQAVISGHTWGRVLLIPYGDSMKNCPHYEDYKRVAGKMASLCNYRCIRACDMYGPGGSLNNPPIRVMGLGKYGTPIYGTEIDWYYRNGEKTEKGNKGSMAIVMEFGTHQRIPTRKDIETEFNMTYKGVLSYIEEAPLVKITWE